MSNWFNTGAQAHSASQEEDKDSEIRKKQTSAPYRFRMKDGESRNITFVDGYLVTTPGLDQGCLDYVQFWEHIVKLAQNKYANYICLKKVPGAICPICEDPQQQSMFSGAFTIIDHTPWTDKNGVEHKYSRRLFIARHDTIKKLTLKAKHYNGLAGITFMATRIGARSASVGTEFEFIRKDPIAVLQNHFAFTDSKTGVVDTLFRPYNYSTDLNFLTEAELRSIGYGGDPKKPKVIGNEMGVGDHNAPVLAPPGSPVHPTFSFAPAQAPAQAQPQFQPAQQFNPQPPVQQPPIFGQGFPTTAQATTPGYQPPPQAQPQGYSQAQPQYQPPPPQAQYQAQPQFNPQQPQPLPGGPATHQPFPGGSMNVYSGPPPVVGQPPQGEFQYQMPAPSGAPPPPPPPPPAAPVMTPEPPVQNFFSGQFSMTPAPDDDIPFEDEDTGELPI